MNDYNFIPVLETVSRGEKGESIAHTNAELIVIDDKRSGVYDPPKLIFASVVDVGVRVRKCLADIINSGVVTILDRKNTGFRQLLSNRDATYTYRLRQHDRRTSHGVIIEKDHDRYLFDWDNLGVRKTFTNYLREKLFIPVDGDIVQSLFNIASVERYLTKMTVYNITEQPLEVWRISTATHDAMKSMVIDNLKNIKIGSSNINWEKIDTITDFMVEFSDEIKEILDEKVTVLYHDGLYKEELFPHFKPYDGQIPLILGGVESLKRNDEDFVYLSAEMGTGKTLMGTAINDIYHKSTGKKGYSTLVVAPNITLRQWRDEIRVVEPDADVFIMDRTDDFIRLYNETNLEFNKPTYIITGKETLKLSYQVKHGVNFKEIKDRETNKPLEVCTCPDCGEILFSDVQNESRQKLLEPKDFKRPTKTNYKCFRCKTPLWQARYTKTRKTSIIDFVKRKKINFNSVIIDEAHEGNNFTSIIGQATRDILRRADKKILLSGTTNSGYASSLFNLLFSLTPQKLQVDGVFDQKLFVEAYGTLQSVMNHSDNENLYASSRSAKKKEAYKEVEGINPLVFTRYMANNYIFANLKDLRSDLPKLITHEIPVPTGNRLLSAEDLLTSDILELDALLGKLLLGTVVKHYVNNPFDWKPIELTIGKNKYSQNKEENQIIVENFEEDRLLPKEEYLIDIVDKVVNTDKEKVMIYTEFVNRGKHVKGKSMQARLEKILKDRGYRVFTLKSSVKPQERNELLQKIKNDYDVFLTHPKLVEVGMNLQYITNYVFYTPSYLVNQVTQASRRGLRINSTKDNNIYHLYYTADGYGYEGDDSFQSIEEIIFERFKLKLAESTAIENKFETGMDVTRNVSEVGSSMYEALKNRK